MTAPHALSEEMPLPGDNPFVTRATRSGMLPFLFPAGESLGGLVDSLRLARWQGQIVGPRGSGKSTLLAALRPEIAGQVSEVVVARLFAAKRFLPPEIQSPPRFPGRPQGKRVFIIDGYEQLSFWRRWRLQHRCRRAGVGLLVSAHHPVFGLPVIYRARITAQTAWRVVAYLMPPGEARPTPDRVTGLLASRAGNVRELLFDLYDWYEEERGRAHASETGPAP